MLIVPCIRQRHRGETLFDLKLFSTTLLSEGLRMYWVIVIGIVALIFYVLMRKNSVHPTV
jgi:hypothetical protein